MGGSEIARRRGEQGNKEGIGQCHKCDEMNVMPALAGVRKSDTPAGFARAVASTVNFGRVIAAEAARSRFFSSRFLRLSQDGRGYSSPRIFPLILRARHFRGDDQNIFPHSRV